MRACKDIDAHTRTTVHINTHFSAQILYTDDATLVPKQDYSCIFLFNASIIRCLSAFPSMAKECFCEMAPCAHVYPELHLHFVKVISYMCKYCWQGLWHMNHLIFKRVCSVDLEKK